MVGFDKIQRYFPELTGSQINKFEELFEIYNNINSKINLISRKDFDNFYIHHVLHSLALVKTGTFPAEAKVMDIGTGGGFPGIPLAIFFPDVHFTLVDSIGKKIRAVDEITEILELKNTNTLNIRTENVNKKFNIVVARAVAPMTDLWHWTRNKWVNNPCFYLLKGGDLTVETNELRSQVPKLKIEFFAISDFFSEDFFETKKVVKIVG